MRVQLKSSLFLLPFVSAVPTPQTGSSSPSVVWSQIIASSPISELRSLCTAFLVPVTVTAQGGTTTQTTTTTQTNVVPSTSTNVVTVTSPSVTTSTSTSTSLTTSTQVVPVTVTSTALTTVTSTATSTSTQNFRMKRSAVSAIFYKLAAANPSFLRSACLLIVKQPTTTKTLPPSTEVKTSTAQATSTAVQVVQVTSTELQPSTTVQVVGETDTVTEQATQTQTAATTTTQTVAAQATVTIGGCQQANVCGTNGRQYRVRCNTQVTRPLNNIKSQTTVANLGTCASICSSDSACALADYESSTKTCTVLTTVGSVVTAPGYAYIYQDSVAC